MARLYEMNIHLKEVCEIVLVNDASPDDSFEGNLAWWQNLKKHEVKYVKNPENLGFGGSMNRGAKKATSEFLIFLSNDVQVSGDFVSPVIQSLTENPERLVGGRIIDWPAGWNEFNTPQGKVVVPWLEGWLLAATRTGWEELGGFDPIFGKFDVEDLDLSTRAAEIGYELVPLNLAFLRHMSGVTINSLNIDRMKITEENKAKYIEKWGNRLPEIYTKAKEIVHA